MRVPEGGIYKLHEGPQSHGHQDGHEEGEEEEEESHNLEEQDVENFVILPIGPEHEEEKRL